MSQDVDEIERIVLQMIQAKVDAPVKKDSTLDSLAIDSIAMAEVTYDIEKTFKIQTDDHILDLESVADVVKYVQTTLAARPNA